MRLIETAIDIHASAARVWSILTDFSAYSAWNPFITAAEGEARPGARLRITIAPPGRRPMTFRPVVLVAVPEQELRWLDFSSQGLSTESMLSDWNSKRRRAAFGTPSGFRAFCCRSLARECLKQPGAVLRR